VLTEEGVAGRLQGPEVQRVGHVPGQAGQQRVGHRAVDHQVPVAAGQCRSAGVERGSHRPGVSDHHRRGQLLVQRPHHRVGLQPIGHLGGQVEMDHLVEGVDAGVGAPGAGEADRSAGHPGQGVGQRPGHRGDLRKAGVGGLSGEASETGTVVGQTEPPAHRWAAVGGGGGSGGGVVSFRHCRGVVVVGRDRRRRRLFAPPGRRGAAHTSSMRAIGALSPNRLPSFRIRV